MRINPTACAAITAAFVLAGALNATISRISGSYTYTTLCTKPETMKNFAVLSLLAIMLLQCKPIDVGQKPEKVKPGETFTLKKGVPVKVTGINNPLTLELNTVADSRCPANAVCVWLGFAKVSLRVANAMEQLQDVQLCIGDCRPDPVRSKHELEVQVGNSKYKLILKEVLPYPGTEEEAQEKTVRMAVEVL